MKQGYEAKNNIMNDPEAQRQIREAMDKLKQEGKVIIDPGYESAVNKEGGEKALFEMRFRELDLKAETDANRAQVSSSQADRMETWQGYLEYRNGLTIGDFQRPASVDDWERLRKDKRERAETDIDDRYASWHALETMRWAGDKPESLKTAREAVKSQLATARTELEQAAAEVQRVWITAPGSQELLQAQARLGERSKIVQRLEKSFRLIEKGT